MRLIARRSPLVIPPAPADPGPADTVPVPAATAFVDTISTNQRGDARYATLATNAGVRVLAGFKNIWRPLTELVDAGVTAPAIVAVAQDATSVLHNDTGNNTGVSGGANPTFGSVVDFANNMGANGSTEPAKRFHKYARFAREVKKPSGECGAVI